MICGFKKMFEIVMLRRRRLKKVGGDLKALKKVLFHQN
jgi:hypothetical protein